MREPEPRRRTVESFPELHAYIGKDEMRIKSRRVGFNAASKYLLKELSIEDDMTESTWLAYLAHKLHTKKNLSSKINRFAEREYGDLPGSLTIATSPFTIPDKLWTAIEKAAKRGPFVDSRGVTSPWLRAAVCYFAFQKRKWPLSRVPAHLWMCEYPSQSAFSVCAGNNGQSWISPL
jgi:hypothetical protein